MSPLVTMVWRLCCDRRKLDSTGGAVRLADPGWQRICVLSAQLAGKRANGFAVGRYFRGSGTGVLASYGMSERALFGGQALVEAILHLT